MDLSYIINRLGEENENYFGAVAPPIFQTTNFSFKKLEDLSKALLDEKNHLIYSRGNNPTLDILSKKIAALEGTDDCLLFSSGMAAISTAIISNLKQGDHVICVQKPYSWTVHLMQDLLPRFGIETSMIDGRSEEAYWKSLKKNTKILFLESPNTFTFDMQDLQKASDFAKENNLISVIDNSYSTPLAQQPHQFGIDIICHSASKYIGGHSDAIAGLLCADKNLCEKIFCNDYLTLGGIMTPFNAWLLLRGLRTLPLRMEKISDTTAKVISFLEEHPQIEKLNYPHSKTHPQFTIAEKQMKFGSGLFSIQLKNADRNAVSRFCESMKYFQIAVSWGGYESLIFPACALTKEQNKGGIPENLLRFSIGLEDADCLINDIKNALSKIL